MTPRMSPPIKPETETETLEEVMTVTLEQGHVYVHCHFNNGPQESLIRIWKSTYLIPKGSSERSELIHAENISIAPVWTRMPKNREFRFLLIFSGLPSDCTVFDMVEDIPEPGGFFTGNINRNSTDVYHIWLD